MRNGCVTVSAIAMRNGCVTAAAIVRMCASRYRWTLDFGLTTFADPAGASTTTPFGLWTLDFGLWTLDFGLQSGAGSKVQSPIRVTALKLYS
jgi:hypothetical protein